MSSTFEKKLQEYRKKKATQGEEFPEDLIPTPPGQKRLDDLQLDAILGAVTVDRAYQRWCNKSPIPRSPQKEGLKVSCPIPLHPDVHPSAWLNIDKGVWNCGACEQGGDIYDIAAYHFGYSVPGYKKENFRELRERMAADLGYFKTTSGGVSSYIKTKQALDDPHLVDHLDPLDVGPTISDISETDTATEQINTSTILASVVPIKGETEIEDIYPFPPIHWKEIVPPETFLWHWMDITTADDVPEEYHFWNGLVAIAMALGRDVTLYDRIPVFGNLFVCTVGHSGDGKSQSRSHLTALLARTLPYKHSDPSSKGVKKINTPGSAEALIHQFSKPILDPTDPKKVAYFAPVRGIVDFNELAAFAGRAGRTGSVLKPVLMEFYDNAGHISTVSMTHGSKEAVDSFASVTTTTQPKAFRDLVQKSDIDSGFLNRWILVGGVPKERVAIGGVKCDTRPCDEYLNRIAAWAGKVRELTWEPDAQAAFEDFYKKILYPQKIADETGLLVRIDLTLKKIALLLTANSKLDAVPLWVVEKLVPLYKYLVECYNLSSSAIGSTLHSEIANEIQRHIVRISATNGGKGASVRELSQRMHRKNFPREHVVKVLKYMTDLGELEQQTYQGKRGPATVRYQNVLD